MNEKTIAQIMYWFLAGLRGLHLDVDAQVLQAMDCLWELGKEE
jgi:hypothetical protein